MLSSDHIVNLLDEIIVKAIEQQASDIHFEPHHDAFRIRYRIDGILHEVQQEPLNTSSYILARLKVLANLDIAERRLPQDGSFRLTEPLLKSFDFRVSTCPTMHGEKAVVRILGRSRSELDFNQLGMTKKQEEIFRDALDSPQGLILVTGPTGSGKTSTLHAALRLLNTSNVNICSIEDPIEISQPGINQVQINPKAGLNFSTVLKAFLRQDPDILMVGEVRDYETAEFIVKAAQTGHLVLTTLHTNNACESLIRLAGIGVERYNLANVVKLIIAQRLVRKLCEECKTPTPKCGTNCKQGYDGRIGIFEVIPISQELRKLILDQNDITELYEQVRREGHLCLYQAALEKMKEGITTLEEIKRVVGE